MYFLTGCGGRQLNSHGVELRFSSVCTALVVADYMGNRDFASHNLGDEFE